MHRPRFAALAVAVLLALACNTPTKRCEHGRDVFVKNFQGGVDAALATIDDAAERAGLVAESKAELVQINARFVEACLALPENGQVCMGKIEELLAADVAARHAQRACPAAANGLPDPVCEDAAQKQRDLVWGDCEAVLEPLQKTLFTP